MVKTLNVGPRRKTCIKCGRMKENRRYKLCTKCIDEENIKFLQKINITHKPPFLEESLNPSLSP